MPNYPDIVGWQFDFPVGAQNPPCVPEHPQKEPLSQTSAEIFNKTLSEKISEKKGKEENGNREMLLKTKAVIVMCNAAV